MLPARTSSCPTVGANCHGGRTTDAKGWLKIGGGSRALVGSKGKVGMRGRGTSDIPRFGALRRDNTPSPGEFSWMVDSTMSLLELYRGGRRLAEARAAPSRWWEARGRWWAPKAKLACAGAGRRTYPGSGLSGEITPLVLASLVGWSIVQCRSWSCIEEEGGWPRLGLLLLAGVAR